MRRPDYSREGIELYCGDCLEILPEMEAGSVDAVVTDGPYGINWVPRVNHQDGPWKDDVRFDPKPWLKIGTQHLFWGANYFADKLPTTGAWLAWIKRPSDHDFSDDGRTYATIELAWANFGKNRHKFHVWDGGKRQGSEINREFCHPSQKPIEVMEWCIPNDCKSVCDPFMGSGTTGVACIRTNCKFIGIEIEPKYFDIAVKRIEAEFDRTSLLDGNWKTPNGEEAKR